MTKECASVFTSLSFDQFGFGGGSNCFSFSSTLLTAFGSLTSMEVVVASESFAI